MVIVVLEVAHTVADFCGYVYMVAFVYYIRGTILNVHFLLLCLRAKGLGP